MFRSMKTRAALAAAALTGAAALLVGCAAGPAPQPTPTETTGASSPLDELIAAAQAEGEVTLYSVPDERVTQQIQTAFQDKYGIKLSYLRATAAEVSQRFAAEAEADATVADVIVTLNDGFLAAGVEDGLFVPMEDADIPDYPGAVSPEALLPGLAVVQLTKLAMGYNTDNAPEIETWEDLLKPELAGKVAISSPENAIHLDLFYVLSEEYGMEFLEELSGQIQRVYTGGSQVVEALSSGEAWAAPGVVAAGLAIAAGQGAPLGWAVPANTLLSPSVMGVVADAPHPAAARLLAHFLMSEEGLELLNGADGQVSPSDGEALNVGWLATPELDAKAASKKAEIMKALGIQ